MERIQYQFPMGKVKRKRFGDANPDIKYQFPMGKVKSLSNMGVFDTSGVSIPYGKGKEKYPKQNTN